jgi:hypothetical protein
MNAGASLSSGSFNIHIGNAGFASDNKTIRIGDFPDPYFSQTRLFAAGIRGITTANNYAVPVLIDSAGQLGNRELV